MISPAATAAHFEIATVASLPTCGRDLCFACLHSRCPDAKAAERADVEAHAPEMAPLSDDALVAICDALDSAPTTLTVSEAA